MGPEQLAPGSRPLTENSIEQEPPGPLQRKLLPGDDDLVATTPSSRSNPTLLLGRQERSAPGEDGDVGDLISGFPVEFPAHRTRRRRRGELSHGVPRDTLLFLPRQRDHLLVLDQCCTQSPHLQSGDCCCDTSRDPLWRCDSRGILLARVRRTPCSQLGHVCEFAGLVHRPTAHRSYHSLGVGPARDA